MKLKSLSTLALAIALTVGVVGCKKRMDRVTPLPGYGAANTLRDPGAVGSGLNTPGGNVPSGIDGTGVTPVNPGDNIPVSPTDISGLPQDREKYRAHTVSFDFDRANVKASEASKVQEVANRFKAEPAGNQLLIEGHCDERGTEGYNQALGERRAQSIREMLVSLGVPAERIHTKSLGKDMPADPGHSESAWSKNRRGEFILVLPR
jgi:outer membrane protein OmpA-like peptidoglycan-associated protein